LYRSTRESGGKTVLDLGTGTGDIAIYFAEAGFSVTGVDISSEMIKQAKEHARENGHEINFECGDAENPRFEDSSFDIITMRNLLWTLPSPEKAIHEWKRVLKPEGKIILSDGYWNNTTIISLPKLLMKTVRRLPNPSIFISFRFFFEYFGIYSALPFYRGITGNQARRLFELSGFRDMELFENCFDCCPYGKKDKRKPEYFILTAKL
jgi:ubiquinone/menaquinone biosynthesis C-methylase UbiE